MTQNIKDKQNKGTASIKVDPGYQLLTRKSFHSKSCVLLCFIRLFSTITLIIKTWVSCLGFLILLAINSIWKASFCFCVFKASAGNSSFAEIIFFTMGVFFKSYIWKRNQVSQPTSLHRHDEQLKQATTIKYSHQTVSSVHYIKFSNPFIHRSIFNTRGYTGVCIINHNYMVVSQT